MTLVSEPGMYRLIMRAKTARAADFQDWVTAEVLPTIRKTGGAYIAPGSQADFDLSDPLTALDKLIEVANIAKVERSPECSLHSRDRALYVAFSFRNDGDRQIHPNPLASRAFTPFESDPG